VKTLPVTESSLVLRTDYSDQEAWESVAAAIQRPVGDFRARVTFLSAPEYDGTTTEQLPSLIPKGFNYSFMFVVDKVSLAHPEHPILAVDLGVTPCRTFRVIPSEMWSIENNLSLANMDFSEFADAVGQDGIFRGFTTLQ